MTKESRNRSYSFPTKFYSPLILPKDYLSLQNLLEEAACQQNIVLQTSQALNVAEQGHEDKRGSPEVIEGERLLLLASKSKTYLELSPTSTMELFFMKIVNG